MHRVSISAKKTREREKEPCSFSWARRATLPKVLWKSASAFTALLPCLKQQEREQTNEREEREGDLIRAQRNNWGEREGREGTGEREEGREEKGKEGRREKEDIFKGFPFKKTKFLFG